MLFKKLDKDSAEVVTAGLDFFTTPPTQCAISNSSYREFLTLNPLNNSPFLFKIHPMQSLIDVSKIYLHTTFRIKQLDPATGALNALAAPVSGGKTIYQKISTIQLPGATFIRNLQVKINQRVVYDSNQLYSYKAWFDHELSYPRAAKESSLSIAGWTPEEKDNPDILNEARMKAFAKSKEVQYVHKLGADLFNQDLYLISNVEMDIEITPQDERFFLMWPAPPSGERPAVAGADQSKWDADQANYEKEYKLEIVDMRLMVKTLDLMDGLNLDIARRLMGGEMARYGIRRTMLKQNTITGGRSQYSEVLFSEDVPRRIIIGLVGRENFNGRKEKSPFTFNHFNVKQITVTTSGRNFPQVPYTLDYENSNYARAFQDHLENLGFANTTESNGISYGQFKTAWCLYVFQLTNSQEDSPAFELAKDGTVHIEIAFAKNTPNSGIALVAYAEMDGLVMIDQNRVIMTDTGA